MLGVYGLRREEMNGLEAARLTDAYVRRVQFEAQAVAGAVWGLLAKAGLPPSDSPQMRPGGANKVGGRHLGGGKYRRVNAKTLVGMMGGFTPTSPPDPLPVNGEGGGEIASPAAQARNDMEGELNGEGREGGGEIASPAAQARNDMEAE